MAVKETPETFTRDDLIYAAGFMDGEGCFEILVPAHKSCVRVKMANSYRPVVEWFHEKFGGTFTECGVVSKRPIYSWGINGINAERFCIAISEHLKEKKPQCEFLIEHRKLGQYGR